MTTEIELDKPRTLRFDFRAFKELETRLGGQSTGRILHRLQELSVTTISAALYVGLKHEDPALTPSHTDAILRDYFARGGSMKPILNAVQQAVMESGILKTGDEESEGNEQTATTTVQ